MDAITEAKLAAFLASTDKGMHASGIQSGVEAARIIEEKRSLMNGAFGTDSYGALALQQGTSFVREVLAVGTGIFLMGKFFGKDDSDKLI